MIKKTLLLISSSIGLSLISHHALAFNPDDVALFIANNGSCESCDLTNADLQNSFLSDYYIFDTNASGADFSESEFFAGGNFLIENSIFTGAKFISVFVEQLEISNSSFTNTNWSNSELELVDVFDSNFTGANFEGTDLFGVNFSNTAGVQTTLSSSLITPLNTCGPLDIACASLENANFKDATITDSSFENMNFTGANFTGATLDNVNLRGATISPLQLEQVQSFSGTLPDGRVIKNTESVPEPSSLLGFIGLGSLMLGGAIRKVKK